MVDSINGEGTWASSKEWVGDMTVAEARNLTGTIIRPFPKEINVIKADPNIKVPDSFDSREQWPNCINPIMNQGHCGSCWAFGLAETLSDRFCIDSGVNVVLSPQYPISCETDNSGCQGGYMDLAWSFAMATGLPTNTCDPYTSGQGVQGSCPGKQCTSQNEDAVFYKAADYNHYEDSQAIMQEIIQHGPVQSAFIVYQDFMSYKGGIYEHKTGKQIGGHSIKIIGWGYENARLYWIVANSWGSDWGINGYFNIYADQCEISDLAIAGMPSTSYI